MPSGWRRAGDDLQWRSRGALAVAGLGVGVVPQLAGLRAPAFVHRSLPATLSPLAEAVGARRPRSTEAVGELTRIDELGSRSS